MEAKTKVCPKCGRELPIENFGKGLNKDGLRSYCKECCNLVSRQFRRKKLGENVSPNPALENFTPRELIDELRARGYGGTLTYTEIKVHKINL